MSWTQAHPDRHLWTPAEAQLARGMSQEAYEALYGRGSEQAKTTLSQSAQNLLSAPPGPGNITLRRKIIENSAGWDRHMLDALFESAESDLRAERNWWRGASGQAHWSEGISSDRMRAAWDDLYPEVWREHHAPVSLERALLERGELEWNQWAEYLLQRLHLSERATREWLILRLLPEMPSLISDTAGDIPLSRPSAHWGFALWKVLRSFPSCRDYEEELSPLLAGEEFVRALGSGGDRARAEEMAERPALWEEGPLSPQRKEGIHLRTLTYIPWGESDTEFHVRHATGTMLLAATDQLWRGAAIAVLRGSTRSSGADWEWYGQQIGRGGSPPSPLLNLLPVFRAEGRDGVLCRLVEGTERLFRSAGFPNRFGQWLEAEIRSARRKKSLSSFYLRAVREVCNARFP